MCNRIVTGLLVLVLLIGLALPGSLAGAQEATPVGGTPVAAGELVREVLVESAPEAAPGEAFQLVRYTVPAGLALPAHTHPGIQMNVIEAGALTYYVVSGGEIVVHRADGSVETIGPGESTTIAEGDSFVEPAGMVHYGANDTAEPVVILTAALLAADEPPSTLVEEPAA